MSIQVPYNLAKSEQILNVIGVLRERLGVSAFNVVDYWPEDPSAVGVCAPATPGVLAYISAASGGDEPFFVSLEFPPDVDSSDYPYTPGDERNLCGIDELVQMVATHLAWSPPNKSLDRT